MPYIKAEDRAPYQKYAKEIFQKFEKNNWQNQFRAVVYNLVQAIYGTSSDTRYFKQNEMIGVISSMLLEWHHRTGASLSITTSKHNFINPSRDLLELLSALSEKISLSDDANRPGNLNYFLTLCMIEAVENSLIESTQVANFMLSILQDLYAAITRKYEALAIEKNGEVFPHKLLTIN